LTTSFAQELALMWNHRPTLTRAELERLGTEEQLALILEEARKTGNLPAGVGIDSLRLLREVFRVNVLAMRGYAPQPFDGKVTLLKAEGGVGDREQAPDMGWAEWARGGVEIHLVPGNHYSLVREPHVPVLAETLKGCIVRAEGADAASLL
jgi:thioesterase domain-containing protein